jgi:hypothetical protein
LLGIIRHAFATAAAILLSLLAAALTLPYWLAPALAALLPAGWHLDELSLAPRPPGLPGLEQLAVSAGGCPLLGLGRGEVALGWHGARPVLDRIDIGTLRLDPACLPSGPGPGSGVRDLPGWVGALFAGTRVEVRELLVAGWLAPTHRLALNVSETAVEAEVEGPVLRLAGHWPMGGAIEVRALQWSAAGLSAGGTTVVSPRLALAEPAAVDPVTGRVRASLRLSADRLDLPTGGRLDRPAVSLRIEGTADDLAWSVEGSAAGGLGPVRAAGRWSGVTLTGRATLTRQALGALQPLLPPTLPAELQAGRADLEADLSWSRAAPSDLRLEGELRVADGRVALTHAVAEGVALRLPFDYSVGVVRIGARQAARLTAERVAAAVDAQEVSLRLAGTWPWSAQAPLRIQDLRLQALGGEATLERLRLPQGREPAVLRLRGIQLDRVSGLYEDAGVSLAGVVEADLPLHLDHATLLVEDGVVRNAGPLRLRLTDAAALEAFKAGNPALVQAADWLADLHLDRLDGTVNLRRDGTLLLEAIVEGRNPARGERPVRLNYRHEENLLHLLQSLRIGSDLSRSIEERLSPRPRSGP